MTHLRKQVRDAVVSRLEPLGGVYVSRVHPIEVDALPVFLISAGNETLQAQQFGALARTFNVNVEIRFDGDPLDDTLDALLVSVEQTLTGNLGGLVALFVPTEIEQPTVIASSDGPIGSARITFQATYRTGINAPESII